MHKITKKFVHKDNYSMKFTISTTKKILSIGLIVCAARGWWLWFGVLFAVLTLVNIIRHAYFKERRAQRAQLEEFRSVGRHDRT